MERAASTGTKSACYFVSCFWIIESNQESTSGFLWMKNESGITSEKLLQGLLSQVCHQHLWLAGEYRNDGEAQDNGFLQRNNNYLFLVIHIFFVSLQSSEQVFGNLLFSKLHRRSRSLLQRQKETVFHSSASTNFMKNGLYINRFLLFFKSG